MALSRQPDDPLFYFLENTIWPFLVSSSGGGGHQAAIEAIRQHLESLREQKKLTFAQDDLPTYNPIPPNEKPRINTQKAQIAFGLDLPQKLKDALDLVGLPSLPDSKLVKREVKKIAAFNCMPRYYIDVLIDIYPSGYETVAIWNIFQKHDQTDELKKLVELHRYSDHTNYRTVRDYFIRSLEFAAKGGQPYTEIISTQAMSLPAMCDAVLYYNNKIAKKYNARPILIHQYMTDLPTPGAVHFLNPLKRLTIKQRNQIILYGVNLDLSDDFNLPGFVKLISIDPKNNPMVRKGFYDPALKNIISGEDVVLPVQIAKAYDQEYKIFRSDKVATIMLGSQASLDTIEYVKKLVESNIYYKIFVFGGTTPHIREQLEAYLPMCPGDIKIIPLDNQDDKHIAPIMCRSDLVITRGGGLSAMEQMALLHLPGQIILIHCKKDLTGKLISGISWEDSNVDELEADLNEKGVQVRRTTTELILSQLLKIKINPHHELEDDDTNRKTYLKVKLNELIINLEKITSQSIKKSIIENLLTQLKNMVHIIDDDSIDTVNVALEIAKFLRNAEEKQKKYLFKHYFLLSFFKQDELTNLLKETKEFIKKHYPSALRKEEEIYRALASPKNVPALTPPLR